MRGVFSPGLDLPEVDGLPEPTAHLLGRPPPPVGIPPEGAIDHGSRGLVSVVGQIARPIAPTA